MQWEDEGYLLSKNNFDENSSIIEVFTLNHGKHSGIVYGGSSRKFKKILQIGNKISLNMKSKSENKMGYFSIELIKPISPFFFEDKKKTTSILSASSILKLLLPERQNNPKIYESFEKFIKALNSDNWIKQYIFWELILIKDLGYEIPMALENFEKNEIPDHKIKEALSYNKRLIMEFFILPNRLKFPLYRDILEKYFN